MGRNTIIRQLREMGVSDWERRKFRELEKQLQYNDFYREVESYNRQFFGESRTPRELSYEALLDYVERGGVVEDILQQRKEEFEYFQETGETKQVQKYFQTLASEMETHGLYVNENALRFLYNEFPEKYEELLTAYADLIKYEEVGDDRMVELVKQDINDILDLANIYL